MKRKMSITIDDSKIDLIEELIKKGIFRNKSHAIEQALKEMLRENK